MCTEIVYVQGVVMHDTEQTEKKEASRYFKISRSSAPGFLQITWAVDGWSITWYTSSSDLVTLKKKLTYLQLEDAVAAASNRVYISFVESAAGVGEVAEPAAMLLKSLPLVGLEGYTAAKIQWVKLVKCLFTSL